MALLGAVEPTEQLEHRALAAAAGPHQGNPLALGDGPVVVGEWGLDWLGTMDGEDTRVFVKFSKPASRDGNTLNGRPVRTEATGAPVFEDAIAWMDCLVRQSIDFGTHTLFVGEVVAAGIEDDDQRAAAMSDTRMKYGGVKRGGHA